MKIFISYRRDDSSGYAGRLGDHLSQQFGRDNIFIDVDKIDVGADFVDTLEHAVASCNVLIALIGTRWLSTSSSDGSRRLDDPGDFVRREVATALAGDGIVIPVLVDGAFMPSADELPDNLKPLARRNAIELTNTRWEFDLARLTEAIEGAGVERVRVPIIRRLALPLIAAVAVVAISVAGWMATRHAPEEGSTVVTVAPSPTPVVIRPSVAVLGLDNATGKEDVSWVGEAVAEMLTTELGAGGEVRTTDRDQVSQASRQLDVEGEERAKVLRRLLGVDAVVTGSYTLLGEGDTALLRLDLRLIDAVSGEILAQDKASGPQAQLFELTERAGKSLRTALGAGELSAAEALAVRASFPKGVEVNRLIFEGLDHLDRWELTQAVELLEQAVKLDPEHPLPHSVLAGAYRLLGHRDRALEEAQRALEVGDSLPPLRRKILEADTLRLQGKHAEAAEMLTELWKNQADDVGLGLRLVASLRTAGETREALAVLDTLAGLKAPLSEDARIDLARSETLQKVQDFAGAGSAAQRAVDRAQDVNSANLLAYALSHQARIAFHQGELEKARSLYRQAKDTFEKIGDRRTAAMMLEGQAHVVRAEGDLSGATRLLERAFEVYREIGDPIGEASVAVMLGRIALELGNLDRAEELLAKAAASYRQAGRVDLAAGAINELAIYFHLRAELSKAEVLYLEAMALFNEAGHRGSFASTMTNTAEIHYLRGRLDDAESLHEEALAIYLEIGDEWSIAYERMRLGMIETVRGDLFVARKSLEKALNFFEAQDDLLAAAEVRVRLAEVKLATGEKAEAAPTARRAEEVFRSEGAADLQALALGVIGRAALAADDLESAARICETATVIADKSQDRRVRFKVGTLRAQVTVRQDANRVGEELRRLDGLEGEAEETGMIGHALEIQLAVAEITARTDPAGAAKLLQELEQRASALGYGLIASRAHALMAGSS